MNRKTAAIKIRCQSHFRLEWDLELGVSIMGIFSVNGAAIKTDDSNGAAIILTLGIDPEDFVHPLIAYFNLKIWCPYSIQASIITRSAVDG